MNKRKKYLYILILPVLFFGVVMATTITETEIITANATFTGSLIKLTKLDAVILILGNSSLLGGSPASGGINLNQTIPEAKSGIWWDAWDEATKRNRPVAWLVAHYNQSSGGDPHTHFSIETLDNSTGTPSLNSHFTITYNGSQTRASLKFPGSDVQFNSEQNLYFGDLLTQAWIVHNSTSGDLELKSNADIQIQATQLDMNQKDIVNIGDIFSTTSVDVKPDTTFRIFPDGQTSRAIQFTDATTHIQISGTGASQIEFLDSVIIDTNDYLQLETNTTAITCDSTTAGAIIFSSPMMYFCNSTDWRAMA